MRIGCCEPEVVVAVHREKDAARASRLGHDMAHELPELRRHAVAGGVRQVHDGGAGFDHRLDRFDEIVEVGSAGVLS